MGYPVCNTTLSDQIINEKPLTHDLTFHKLGLIISVLSSIVAVVIAGILIVLHATHYAQPYIQRHIIRILSMIPIYAVVSFLSFLYYRHAIYFQVLRDCYEAIAIASFFTLLSHYIAPNLHDQKVFFRGLSPRDWVLPISWFKRCCGGDRGIWRTPQSGLTWFNIIFLGVYQYCFVRVLMTFISVITEAAGVYCEQSLNPAFSHIWVMVIEAASVSVAMYCLVQFYIQLKGDLASHRPGLKLLCIKLVVFFAFWQTLLISFLTSAKTNFVMPTDSVSYSDLTVGIPSILLCCEMAIFAVLHIFAFPWKEFRKSNVSAVSEFYEGTPDYKGGPLGIKAYADAFNPWDLIKAVARGFKWLFVGRKTRREDESYKSTTQGVGLEPRRDGVLPDGVSEEDSASFNAPVGRKSTFAKKYTRLSRDDDQDTLLSNAQAQPYGRNGRQGAEPYVGPHPTLGRPLNEVRETGDIGDSSTGPERWNEEMQPHEAAPPSYNPYVSGDTSYHGGSSSVTIPPQPRPGNPPYPEGDIPLQESTGPHGADWDMWAGTGAQRERREKFRESPGPTL